APTLTDRQKREIEYHQKRASAHARRIRISSDVLDSPRRRWWNAYWTMYTILMQRELRGKRVLVVGCGFGEDAVLLAKLGAEVWAFDLSPESLEVARNLAAENGVEIHSHQTPAEDLPYEDDFF